MKRSTKAKPRPKTAQDLASHIRAMALHVDKGGAVINVRTRQIYYSLRELPADIFATPGDYKRLKVEG